MTIADRPTRAISRCPTPLSIMRGHSATSPSTLLGSSPAQGKPANRFSSRDGRTRLDPRTAGPSPARTRAMRQKFCGPSTPNMKASRGRPRTSARHDIWSRATSRKFAHSPAPAMRRRRSVSIGPRAQHARTATRNLRHPQPAGNVGPEPGEPIAIAPATSAAVNWSKHPRTSAGGCSSATHQTGHPHAETRPQPAPNLTQVINVNFWRA